MLAEEEDLAPVPVAAAAAELAAAAAAAAASADARADMAGLAAEEAPRMDEEDDVFRATVAAAFPLLLPPSPPVVEEDKEEEEVLRPSAVICDGRRTCWWCALDDDDDDDAVVSAVDAAAAAAAAEAAAVEPGEAFEENDEEDAFEEDTVDPTVAGVRIDKECFREGIAALEDESGATPPPPPPPPPCEGVVAPGLLVVGLLLARDEGTAPAASSDDCEDRLLDPVEVLELEASAVAVVPEVVKDAAVTVVEEVPSRARKGLCAARWNSAFSDRKLDT